MLIMIVVFATATIARIWHRYLPLWALWATLSIFSLFTLWRMGESSTMSFGVVGVSSILGFLAPEIWEGIRNAVRRPHIAVPIALVVLGGGTIAFYPEIAEKILVLAIIVLALWVMVRPLFQKSGKKG